MNRRSDFREPIWILATWCVFCAWVVAYCAGHYLPTSETNRRAENTEVAAVNESTTAVESVGVEVQRGQAEPERSAEIATVLGLPSWVFWGIALPWCFATGFTVYFASSVMEEESLDA